MRNEMKKKKNDKIKLPMSLTKRIMLVLLAVVLSAGVIYLAYYVLRYSLYFEHEKYLTSYEAEAGVPYSPLKEDASDVPGYELVAENGTLKLYTRTSTADIAVYDKRSGLTTYSTPQNAEEDPVANTTNKNFLRSQLLVYFYNSEVKSGSYDSYSQSVAKGQFSYESIENGIRYNYKIGELVNSLGEEGQYFDISLDYRLDGDSVTASVPASLIGEHGSIYVYRIQLLRYMGACDSSHEGYLVVPNATGSLIRFNNGKTEESMYSQYIYDIDPMVSDYTTKEQMESAKLPVCGICSEEKTVMMTVEQGASTALISAGVSGMFNDYNFAYTIFVLRNRDNLRMFGNSQVDTYVLEDNVYDIDYTVRYSFLDSRHNGYTGIAEYYRDKLIADGTLKKLDASENIPFFWDALCGVKETGHILGVQYLHTFSMTTFEEAGMISDELKAMGIDQQIVSLLGWMNGGYYHDATDKLRLVHKLGSKKDLSELNRKISENGGLLFADAAFQKVSFADDSFNPGAEGSRYYGAGYVASFGLLHPTTLRNTASLGYRENMYDLLSPRYLPRYVGTFASKITRYDVDGISLRDLANTLQSDKRRTRLIDREQALSIVLGQFDVLKDTGKKILSDNANAYAFAYSDAITDTPVEHNTYPIVDESIPLYQMIIHGSIPYAGKVMNYEDSYTVQDTLLRMIEYGAYPHYIFTEEESNRMKETALNRMYATTFDTLKDSALEVYRYLNGALGSVTGSYMTGHEILSENLRKVTYDNGNVIYVNYGDSEAAADGLTIGARSYRLEVK